MFERGLIPVWMGVVLLSGMFLMGQDTWPSPPTCPEDSSEQNDSVAAAYDLGTITDCDDDVISLSANIEPAYDDDWFKIHIQDDVCTIVPTFRLSGLASGEIYALCVDYYCDSSSAPSIPDASQCTNISLSGEINLSFNCPGTLDQSGTALIRIAPQAAGECAEYYLDIHG